MAKIFEVIYTIRGALDGVADERDSEGDERAERIKERGARNGGNRRRKSVETIEGTAGRAKAVGADENGDERRSARGLRRNKSRDGGSEATESGIGTGARSGQ